MFFITRYNTFQLCLRFYFIWTIFEISAACLNGKIILDWLAQSPDASSIERLGSYEEKASRKTCVHCKPVIIKFSRNLALTFYKVY